MSGISPGRRRDPEPERRDASFLRLVEYDGVGEGTASGAPLPDPVALLLSESRSADTRTAYQGDYRAFFGADHSPADVIAWAGQPVTAIAADLQRFKGEMIQKGLSEATVNRRLAALRSLLTRCRALGLAETDGRGLVRSERVTPYRNTRGVSLKLMRRLLEIPDVATEKGKRDMLILRLALENGLRVAEICSLNVPDLSHGEKRLRIRGKGRGQRAEWVEISSKAVAAAKDYLSSTSRWKTAGKGQGPTGSGPLLLSCDHRPEYAGKRITSDGVYAVVQELGREIGVQLSPHRLRHSAITQVLRLTNGNLAEAQDFSRHSDPSVLQRYNDNAGRAQGRITRKLSREL